VRCRRCPGEPTEGTAPISARRVALRTLGPPSRHRSGPDRRRTRDRRGTHPGGDRSPRGPGGLSGPSSPRRPARRRSCTSSRRGERRRPSLRWCGRRSGPRLFARADVPRERPGERGQGRRRCHGVCRRHPLATLVAPNPGHCHEPGDLVPPDVVAGLRRGDDMSVWIPYLRSSPAGRRPGWGRGPRPRSPSRRVPARCLEVGVRVTRACGRWARWSPRCSEAGEGRCERSLRPRRTPRRDIGISFVRRSSRFSLDHGFVRSRSRSPRDRPPSMSASRPTPVRL